jgi:hypothetical protein
MPFARLPDRLDAKSAQNYFGQAAAHQTTISVTAPFEIASRSLLPSLGLVSVDQKKILTEDSEGSKDQFGSKENLFVNFVSFYRIRDSRPIGVYSQKNPRLANAFGALPGFL